MASRKTYLYGLGTGLIAGALLLQLASIGESASVEPEPNAAEALELTPEQFREAAEARGFVLQPANETWMTRAEAEKMAADAEARVRAELQAAAGDEGAGGIVYGFTIAPGTELTTIARLLYELGLVDDYNGFLLEMNERKLAGKVQAKHFRFDAVPTTDELIEALTTP